MNRRTFIGTSAVAGVGVATTAFQCSKPRALVITIITGAVAELRILFPNMEVLGKIASLATSLKAAWDAGKFDDARTFFVNLDTLIGQVITDLGVNATTQVRLILAALGIGLRAVAALIQSQSDASPVAAAAARSAAPQTMDRVKELADPKVADDLLKAVKRP